MPDARADSVQPGGREPAPGELGLLQAFLNTYFDLEGVWGSDLLDDPRGLERWLASRQLLPASAQTPSPRELRDVIAVREGLRAMADCGEHAHLAGNRDLLEALTRARLGVELGNGRLVLAPQGQGVGAALSKLLAIAFHAMSDGRWARMKSCPGDHCGWVFFDRSRNNSGRWCSMSVCGGRAKARSHYDRHRLNSAAG